MTELTAGVRAANIPRSGRIRLAALILILTDIWLLGVWALWLPGFLTGHPASTDPTTGIVYPWPILLAAGPMAIASFVAARQSFLLTSLRVVLIVAVLGTGFAALAVATDWAKPIVLIGHAAALGLIASGRSAFRS